MFRVHSHFKHVHVFLFLFFWFWFVGDRHVEGTFKMDTTRIFFLSCRHALCINFNLCRQKKKEEEDYV